MEKADTTLWTRLLAITASTLATIAGVSLMLGYNDLKQEQRDNGASAETAHALINGMAITLAEAEAYRKEQERENGYWQERIEINTTQIHQIQNDAAARRDPFTGTEGDEHERRIDACERGLVALASLEDRVARNEEHYAQCLKLIKQGEND